MSMSKTINGQEFLRVVCPHLESADAEMLVHAVGVRWTPHEVCGLLRDEDVDVRRVAALVLGLIGRADSVACLTRALRDQDARVNEMAENGLWSIWFRLCKPSATGAFKEGVAFLSAEAYGRAISRFDDATRIDPQFAESFNQCAIAHYFLRQWKESIADCGRAIRLMPCHFGAIAGMGHCYAQLDDLDMAHRCYRQALRVNPRMKGVRRAAERIKSIVSEADTSGEFMVDQINY